MPSLDWNKQEWGVGHDWPQAGDEWSEIYGGSDMQWFGSILPRLHAFLPLGTVLEIAPGYGRWTQYLKEVCDKLVVVDLAENCIEACRKRFADDSHIEYHVNDGKSLEAIDDNSIDFVFSYDSLVHCEEDIIRGYLEQLRSKLRPDGVGFIHHSNLGEHVRYFSRIDKIPVGKQVLARIGLVEMAHCRARSVSASLFAQMAEQSGLKCISQELVNWGVKRRSGKRTIDCISTFTPAGSRWVRDNQVLQNAEFMDEARHLGRLASLYGVRT